MSVTIAAVIPTRNRPHLAMNAVRSLLDQDVPVDIFVSDNSPSPDAALRDLERSEPRVHYLRPPRELRMAENWDWAVRQAMERSDATHVTVHYDRKISKPRQLHALQSAVETWPDLVITFPVDFVYGYPPPLRLWQVPWTGKGYLIKTSRVANLTAAGRASDLGQAFPILSNCLVPRDVLDAVIDRFGDLCNSTSPDTCFTYRFCTLHSRYLHLDRPLGILYASDRSNGLGYLRSTGGDFADFQKGWGDRAWLDAAPLPGVNLGFNMLYHEYELVRRAAPGQLPPIDRAACLNQLAEGLRWLVNPEEKTRLHRLLEGQGWSGETPEFVPPTPQHIVSEAIIRFLADHFGRVPDTITGFAFRNDDEALRYAGKYPRRVQESHEHLDVLDPVPAGAA